MTIIIGLKDDENERIILGSDRQGTADDISVNYGCKIFTKPINVVDEDNHILGEEYITFCMSGSHYLQSYLTPAFTPPGILKDEDFVDYLYSQFFQTLNNELSGHNLLYVSDGVLDSESSLILVFKGELYNVHSDFSIVEAVDGVTCNGSGWKIALSVLTNLLQNHSDMDKIEMVKEALETTGELNIYCNKDYDIREIRL